MNLLFILIFGAGVVLGAVAVWVLFRKKPKQPSGSAENVEVKTIIEKQAEEQQKNRQKILDYLEQKQDDSITNDEAQNLLGVSDASAERYLDGLEKDGVLRQVGKTGVKTFYQKI